MESITVGSATNHNEQHHIIPTKTEKVENAGIDPAASRMLSERSTI
jgi:hypothetical protein